MPNFTALALVIVWNYVPQYERINISEIRAYQIPVEVAFMPRSALLLDHVVCRDIMTTRSFWHFNALMKISCLSLRITKFLLHFAVSNLRLLVCLSVL